MRVVEFANESETANALLGAFIAHAGRASQTIALRAGGAEVSYAGLLVATARFAAALDARGVAPGDVVAIGAERSVETIALILAIIASGAAYLPLDPGQADARLQSMIETAHPRLLVGGGELRARLDRGGGWVDRSELSATQSVLNPRRAGALAYVLFTSGSTGEPKGVAMRSTAVAALIDWHRAHARLSAAARTLQFAPLGFDVSFQEIFSTLSSGGTLILPSESERRDPWALLALMRRERIERAFLPVAALQAIADAAATDADALPPSLTDVIVAGERLRITAPIRAFFAGLPACVLHNHYGPTETHVVTAHELDGAPDQWPELPPIGLPLPHVRVRVECADAPADDGRGELLLGGECLAAGYIGRPDLTAQSFIDLHGERWYRTGDCVRRNAAGELEYLARLDDQLKIAGHRVEPAEVEAVLYRHPDIAQAAVVAEPGEAGARLIAHVVARDSRSSPAQLVAMLADHCRTALPDYLRPQRFELHSLLPHTTSGKVDRHALARASDHTVAWDDTAPLLQQLTQLWTALLGVRPDASTNLFDAGARSLMVVHALTALRRHGHRLSVAQVYDNPTIAAQLALLTAAARQPQPTADTQLASRQRAAFARFARSGDAA